MTDFKKVTRSSITTVQLQQREYKAIITYEPKPKLPLGLYLLGRMIHLCQPASKGEKQISKADASRTVAKEVCSDWISKNVYPKTERAVAKQIKDDYETLMPLARYQRSEHKKYDKWTEKATQFNDTMCSHAYDIRTKNIDLQRSLETDTGVKMTEADEQFYLDNCYGAYKAICTSTIPKDWARKKKTEETRKMSAERKRLKMDDKQKELKGLDRNPDAGETDDETCQEDDEPFLPERPVTTGTSVGLSPRQTRSRSVTSSSVTDCAKQKFPDVKIRTGRKNLNEALVRCVVQCLSEFKVSHVDIAGIMVRTANMIFNQKWRIASDGVGDDDGDGTDHGSEDDSTDTPVMRKRKSWPDLTHIFPSKRCISMYLEDAYLLNLKHVANYLTNKDANVVTVGFNDTTKAAGHKLYDIKADHITVHGPKGRKSRIQNIHILTKTTLTLKHLE
jgi:hypothetical protein